jgi:hypothetical protein
MIKNKWLLILLIILLMLPACSSSKNKIAGNIEEYQDYPIAGRKIAICQFQADQEFYTNLPDSMLLDKIATSDKNGYFEFTDVPEGNYLLLYDSGLVDFETAVEKWAGKTLKLSDYNWIAHDYLGSEDGTVKMNIYNGMLNLLVEFGGEAAKTYMRLHLILDNSPFIVAHDVEKAVKENKISIIVVKVPQKGNQVSFPAIHLGKLGKK